MSSEEASTLKISGISSRTMDQSITPSLSQTIWPRWASRQFVPLPIVQTLLPVTFGYSLSSEAVIMRQLRRWKRLWRRSLTRSHKRTSMGPSRSCCNGTTNGLQPEEITSKGIYSFTCVLSIKKSGNLFNDPRIYLSITKIPTMLEFIFRDVYQSNILKKTLTFYLKKLNNFSSNFQQNDDSIVCCCNERVYFETNVHGYFTINLYC